MQSYELIPPESEALSQSQTPLEKPRELPALSKVEIKVPAEPIHLIAKPVDLSWIQRQWANYSEPSQKPLVPQEVLAKDSGIGKVISQEPSQGSTEVISVVESKSGILGKPEVPVFNPSRPAQMSAKGFRATGVLQSAESSQGEMPVSFASAKESRPVHQPESVQAVKPQVIQFEGKAVDPETFMGKESSPTNSVQQSWKSPMNSIRLSQPVSDMQQSSGFSEVTGNVSDQHELQQPLNSTQSVQVDLRSQFTGVQGNSLPEFQQSSSQPVEAIAPKQVFTQESQPIRMPVPETNPVTPRNGEVPLQSSFQAESNPVMAETRPVVDSNRVEPMANPTKGSSPVLQPDLLRPVSISAMNEAIPVLNGDESIPTGRMVSYSNPGDLQAMVRDSLSGKSVDNSPLETVDIQASSPKLTSKADIPQSQYQTQVESTRIEMPPHRSIATLGEPIVLTSEGDSDSGKVEVSQPQVKQSPVSLGKRDVNPLVTERVVPIQMSEFTRKDSGAPVVKEPVVHSGFTSTATEIVRTHPVGKVYPNEPVIVPEAQGQVQDTQQSEFQRESGLEFAMNKTHEINSKEELSLKSEVRSPESTSSWMQEVSNVRSSQGTDAVQQVKGLRLSPGIPESDLIIDQIARQVNQRLTPGGGEMRLQLVPDDLGKLRIQVGVEDGIVRARIVTETAEVRSLLEHHVDDLKIALAEQGLRIQEVKLTLAGGGEDYMAGSQGQSQGHRYSGSQVLRNSTESVHYSQDQHPQEQERRPYPERWEKLLGNGQGHVDYRA